MLTREEFLGTFQRRYVSCSYGGREYLLQNLNEDEFAEFGQGQVTKDGKISDAYTKVRRRRLIVACLVDADHTRFLRYSDLGLMGNLDSGLISALFAAAAKHCGLIEEDEGREKNSGEAPDDDSPTGSPCAGES